MSQPADFTIVATDVPALRDNMLAWAALGLLRSSVWLSGDDIAHATGPVMATQVTLLDEDGPRQVSLRDVFGDAVVGLVRVIAVRQVIDDAPDGELPRRLWAFADRLAEKLSTNTEMLRLNLVVPGGEFVGAKEILEKDCDLNVIASPEDRPREGAIDHQLDRREIFDAHTTLACATVGAMWRHTADSPFDKVEGARTGARGGIVITRAAARLIDGRHLPDQIVRELLDNGVVGVREIVGDSPNRPVNEEDVVRRVVANFLSANERTFNYQDRRPVAEPPRQRMMRKTFHMMVKFFAELLLKKTVEWRHKVMLELGEAIEKWLVVATPDDTGALLSSQRPTTGEILDLALQAPDAMPRVAPAYPHVWPPLRQMAFAMIDDGPLPAEMAETWNTLTPNVSHPRWITPDPDARFKLSDEQKLAFELVGIPNHDIRAGDTNAVARFELRLRIAAETIGNHQTAMAAEDRKMALDVLAQCGQELGKWREGSAWDKSVVGRLATHIDQQIAKAALALRQRRVDYFRETADREKTLAQLERTRDRACALLGKLGLGAASLALVLWVVVAAASGSGLLWQLLFGTTLVASGAGAVWATAFMAMAGRATALEHQLDWIEARRNATIQSVHEWPTEGQRLGSLYEVLLDWGEVLGWMLYRPFGKGNDKPDDSGVVDLPRPEAFQLGRSNVADNVRHKLVESVTRSVFTPGWISALYDELLDEVIPERTDPEVVATAAVDPDMAPGPVRAADLPDGEVDQRVADGDDTGHGDRPPRHARDLLLRRFRDGTCEAKAWSRLASAIRRTLRDQPPGKLMSEVVVPEGDGVRRLPALEYLSGVLPKPTDGAPTSPLAPTILSDIGRVDGHNRISRVHLWGSVNGMEKSGLAVPQHEAVLVHPAVTSGSSDDPMYISLIRLDVTAGCEEQDLALSNRPVGDFAASD